MLKWGSWGLPFIPIAGWEAPTAGVRMVGNGVLGNMEHKEEILLWKNPAASKNHPRWGYWFFRRVPETMCFTE